MPYPVKAPVSFGYGLFPTDPDAIRIYKQLGLKGHNGDDYAVYKVPTYSIVRGVVVVAGWVNDGGGWSVRIRFTWKDGREYIVQHDHLSRVDVTVGQTVDVGQQVGITGNSGSTAGYHLHFSIRPVSGYNPNDGYYGYINPAPFYEAQGGADDVTNEQFASIILDVIEDKPHYKDQQPDAFRGHVDWLNVEGKKDPWNYNRWVKGIMANNGVLNATYMREHLKNDERSLAAARAEVREVVKEIEVIKEVPVEVIKEVTKEVPVEVVREVVKEVPVPVESLSPLELIRIALNKFLKGGA